MFIIIVVLMCEISAGGDSNESADGISQSSLPPDLWITSLEYLSHRERAAFRSTNQKFNILSGTTDVGSLRNSAHHIISRDDQQRDVASSINNPIEYLRFVLHSQWTSTNCTDYIEFIETVNHEMFADWWKWSSRFALKLVEDGVFVNLSGYRRNVRLLYIIQAAMPFNACRTGEIWERLLVALASQNEIDTIFRNRYAPWIGRLLDFNAEVDLMREYQMWTLHQSPVD